MPNFLEKNKIFIAIVISGLLISSAISSLGNPSSVEDFDAPADSEVKDLAIEPVFNDQEESNISESVAPLESPDTQSGLYKVTKVVDGDTIAVDIDGNVETLRLIGINTPETVDPRKPVECFGKEASNKAKEILTGKSVRLEADITQGELDKYNRLLRYVFLEDGTSFNKMMISEGYAYEYTYGTPYKYQDEFNQAEKEAREDERGLWAPGVCEVTTTIATTPTPAPVVKLESSTVITPTPASASSQYDCSGNVYNCSDFSTHDEAQAVYDSCGGVDNDIHRLDADKDGGACESLP